MDRQKEEAEMYIGLFNLMNQEYDLLLTTGEMDEIIYESEKIVKLFCKPDVSGQSEMFISLIKELINVGIIDEDDIDVGVWVKNYIKEINRH